MYKLKYTKDFEKNLKSLTQQEQKLVANKLKLLIQNPFFHYLKLVKL